MVIQHEELLSSIAELAEKDDKALSLICALESARDWGEEDMALCAIESYLKRVKGELQ